MSKKESLYEQLKNNIDGTLKRSGCTIGLRDLVSEQLTVFVEALEQQIKDLDVFGIVSTKRLLALFREKEKKP